MAGLNFQTQTIINANIDKDSNNADLFVAKKAKVDGVEKDVLQIKRDFLFVKDVKLLDNKLYMIPHLNGNDELSNKMIVFDLLNKSMESIDLPFNNSKLSPAAKLELQKLYDACPDAMSQEAPELIDVIHTEATEEQVNAVIEPESKSYADLISDKYK